MSLLVFGRSGQVAMELIHRAPGATYLDRQAVDLTDPAACAAAISSAAPGAVINTAAYTDVDRAEEQEDLATTVNAEAPGAMARTCAALDIPFVHISTDYVFDGTGDHPWQTDDVTTPLNAYGRSKLAGERRVAAEGGRYAVMRTSWVFSRHGSNFVKTMLRLSEGRNILRIVDDQIGGPTPARDIAAACLSIVGQLKASSTKSGTYHFSGGPDISRKAFAEEIFARSGRHTQIEGVSSTEFPCPAPRPLNSRLDCDATEAVFGIDRPDWRGGLELVLNQLGVSRS